MRYLLIILSFLFWSCSIYDIAARRDSGTIVGHNNGDCIQIERTCVEKNGQYDYNINPEAPDATWMCSCSWSSNNQK